MLKQREYVLNRTSRMCLNKSKNVSEKMLKEREYGRTEYVRPKRESTFVQ